jgi:hypothetical protein
MQVGVAHPAKQDLDLDVVRTRVAPRDAGSRQRGRRIACCERSGGEHDFPSDNETNVDVSSQAGAERSVRVITLNVEACDACR